MIERTEIESEADWKKPLPEQEVSNRSILRVQQLANELKGDLNSLPIFRGENRRKVREVLFATIDPNHSYKGSGSASRWYNFRLCSTYRFPDVVKSWLTYDRNRTARLFRPFFDAARQEDRTTRASFDVFEDALFRKQRDYKLAHDQLLIALAVIPYKGVLLSLFEEAMGMSKAPNLPESWNAKLCCAFSGPLKQVSIHPWDAFRPNKNLLLKPQATFDVPELISSAKDVFRVLLPLTRGERPSRQASDDSPYPPEPGFDGGVPTALDSQSEPQLEGFFVPAFDTYEFSVDSDVGEWKGGFAGWMVALFDNAGPASHPSEDSDAERKDSWLAFTHLMRTFVRQVREAHMLDLLEEYADLHNQPAPRDYLGDHIHHIIGWKKGGSNEAKSRDMTLHFDPPAESLTINLSPFSTDTRWSSNDTWPAGNLRLCKQFLSGLRTIRAQRGHGKEDTLEDISHEIKQVANALIGNWSLPPDEKLRPEVNAFFLRMGYTNPPLDVAICPVPHLISTSAKVFQLWTGEKDPNVFFETEPRDLQAVFRVIWNMVIASAQAVLSRKVRFDVAASFDNFIAAQSVLHDTFRFEDIFSFQGPLPNLILPSDHVDPSTAKRWSVFIRLLTTKFKDIVRHADPEKECAVVVSGGTYAELVVLIKNHKLDRTHHQFDSAKLATLYQRLMDIRFFKSDGQGQKVLEHLQWENPDFIALKHISDDPIYQYEMRFNWSAPL